MIAIAGLITATFLHALPIQAQDNELTRKETRQGWR